MNKVELVPSTICVASVRCHIFPNNEDHSTHHTTLSIMPVLCYLSVTCTDKLLYIFTPCIPLHQDLLFKNCISPCPLTLASPTLTAVNHRVIYSLTENGFSLPDRHYVPPSTQSSSNSAPHTILTANGSFACCEHSVNYHSSRSTAHANHEPRDPIFVEPLLACIPQPDQRKLASRMTNLVRSGSRIRSHAHYPPTPHIVDDLGVANGGYNQHLHNWVPTPRLRQYGDLLRQVGGELSREIGDGKA